MNLSVRRFSLLLLVVLAVACGDKKNNEKPVADNAASSYNIAYTVVSELPHNEKAWTQGLLIDNNKVIESTGQNGHSWIAEVNPGTGEHQQKITLTSEFFGEGVAILNHKLYQLTWQNKKGFIYDARTYTKLGEFAYEAPMAEGWGLTTDGKQLIASDGTERLHFIDTTDLKIKRSLTVLDGARKVKQLNELEYINGFIYANVWQTADIVKIDPATGKVVGRLDLSRLAANIQQMFPQADVLNGIAYDKNSKSLLVTGKLWPRAYLIKIAL